MPSLRLILITVCACHFDPGRSVSTPRRYTRSEARRKPLYQTLDRLAVPFPMHAPPPRRLDAALVQFMGNLGHRHVLRGKLLDDGTERCRERHCLLLRLAALLVLPPELHPPRRRPRE